ncbi:PIN domain nuclease [Roseomonas sp. AR75]|uniref:type II toxin-antitoxin system VapC family toxin n=1 Tax=Roseomonas sp. AR75 TaxID=2562311 RepID=UPI0010BFE63D|nr:PIN domain nuclease [Roseomonas sp. AR75]
MILVDTSVWVDFLRDTPSPEAVLLDRILDRQTIVVGDLVLCEVLQGVANEAAAARIEEMLREFLIMPVLDDTLASAAAHNFRHLRGCGVTVRKTIDLLIGTFCIRHRFRLLHRDRDFDAMEQHLGLRVLHA